MKEKISSLNYIRKTLMDDQIYIAAARPKNDVLRLKIEYINCLKEYLITGNCVNHKGRLDGIYTFKPSEYKFHYLIEETINRDLRAFVRKIEHEYFKTPEEVFKFRGHRSRIY